MPLVILGELWKQPEQHVEVALSEFPGEKGQGHLLFRRGIFLFDETQGRVDPLITPNRQQLVSSLRKPGREGECFESQVLRLELPGAWCGRGSSYSLASPAIVGWQNGVLHVLRLL